MSIDWIDSFDHYNNASFGNNRRHPKYLYDPFVDGGTWHDVDVWSAGASIQPAADKDGYLSGSVLALPSSRDYVRRYVYPGEDYARTAGFWYYTSNTSFLSGPHYLLSYWNRNDHLHCALHVTTSGTLQVWRGGLGGVLLVESEKALQGGGVAQYIEALYLANWLNPGSARFVVRINGYTVLNITGVAINGAQDDLLLDRIDIGSGDADPAPVMHNDYFKNFFIGTGISWDHWFHGPLDVQVLHPRGAGTYTQWTPVPNPPNWATVSEDTASGSEYVGLANASGKDSYPFDTYTAPPAPNTILMVQPSMWQYSPNTQSARGVIKRGAYEAVFPLTAGWTHPAGVTAYHMMAFKQDMESGGTNWTAATLNATEWGVTAPVGVTVSCYQYVVEVVAGDNRPLPPPPDALNLYIFNNAQGDYDGGRVIWKRDPETHVWQEQGLQLAGKWTSNGSDATLTDYAPYPQFTDRMIHDDVSGRDFPKGGYSAPGAYVRSVGEWVEPQEQILTALSPDIVEGLALPAYTKVSVNPANQALPGGYFAGAGIYKWDGSSNEIVAKYLPADPSNPRWTYLVTGVTDFDNWPLTPSIDFTETNTVGNLRFVASWPVIVDGNYWFIVGARCAISTSPQWNEYPVLFVRPSTLGADLERMDRIGANSVRWIVYGFNATTMANHVGEAAYGGRCNWAPPWPWNGMAWVPVSKVARADTADLDDNSTCYLLVNSTPKVLYTGALTYDSYGGEIGAGGAGMYVQRSGRVWRYWETYRSSTPLVTLHLAYLDGYNTSGFGSFTWVEVASRGYDGASIYRKAGRGVTSNGPSLFFEMESGADATEIWRYDIDSDAWTTETVNWDYINGPAHFNGSYLVTGKVVTVLRRPRRFMPQIIGA